MIRLLAILALLLAVALAANACHEAPPPPEQFVLSGDARRGLTSIRKHGCGGCHVIPGVREARGTVAPSLEGLARRPYLAGRLLNSAGNLIDWIRDPQAIEPGTIMPRLGVSEPEARDIAAYLYGV